MLGKSSFLTLYFNGLFAIREEKEKETNNVFSLAKLARKHLLLAGAHGV
jgi:hypothetical protein